MGKKWVRRREFLRLTTEIFQGVAVKDETMSFQLYPKILDGQFYVPIFSKQELAATYIAFFFFSENGNR